MMLRWLCRLVGHGALIHEVEEPVSDGMRFSFYGDGSCVVDIEGRAVAIKTKCKRCGRAVPW